MGLDDEIGVADLRQAARPLAGDADHLRSAFARGLDALEDRFGLAGVGDRDQHVAGLHRERRHELLMRVDRGDAGLAEQRKLLLRVLRDDARRAEAEELDLSRGRQEIDGERHLMRIELPARAIEAGQRVLEILSVTSLGPSVGEIIECGRCMPNAISRASAILNP